MRLLNIPHEPTSLVLGRVFYIVIAVVASTLAFAYYVKDALEMKDVYQVEYYSEILPVPVVLFRVVTNRTERIRPEFTLAAQPKNIRYFEEYVELMMDYVSWNKNVTDSKSLIQDWKSIDDDRKYNSSDTTKTLQMFMIKPSINATFAPNITNINHKTKSEKTPTTEITISFWSYIRVGPSLDLSRNSITVVDVFVINNSTMIADGINVKEPLDLGSINARYRFRANAGTKVMIDFLQSYKVTNDNEEPIRDVRFTEQRGLHPSTIEFSIAPGNKPSPDGKTYIVKKEKAKRPLNPIQVAGTAGGAFTVITFIFTFLFGQRRLRPWGFVQRRLLRNKILKLLPSSMTSLKSSYKPELNQDSITDMTYLNQPHPLQRGIATSWMPKTTDDKDYNANILHQNSYLNTHPHPDEIDQLRSIVEAQMETQRAQMEAQKAQTAQMEAQVEAQMKQSAMILDRLTALESGNTCPDNTTAMLNSLIANNNRLPHLSLNQHHTNSTIMPSGTASSVESRLSKLEMFQYRLGTFYLSSDLFDDTAHT
ncbi:hypothetical protein BDF22DRAFT_693748 [Syncephalis plumigaleata]|nr:hypothetical protein BDF22DRAFT_693748 [Syncephalis plumigaleata]